MPKQGNLTKNVCASEEELVAVVAQALRDSPAPVPRVVPEIGQSMRGNLGEFGVWDLGERHWLLYERKYSQPANADSPWRNSSTSGIDILAVLISDPKKLQVIEVKTSIGNGAGLITGGNSSMQKDFSGLFKGDVESRLQTSVSKLLSRFRYVDNDRVLEEEVKAMVGQDPANSASINLFGILLCTQGSNADNESRERAFERLTTELVASGWQENQVHFMTVEVEDFLGFVQNVVGATLNAN